MGENRRIASYFTAKRSRFECQSSNASAFVVALGASILPGLVCLHGLLLVQFCLFFVPNTMEDVHVFEGVAYVPIRFIRDKQHDWVSAGWLSKQMAHMEMGVTLRHMTASSATGGVVMLCGLNGMCTGSSPQLRPQQISALWTSGRVCQRPSPCCMPWQTVPWQCLPAHRRGALLLVLEVGQG